jgi:phosphatidylglycerophosphatase A
VILRFLRFLRLLFATGFFSGYIPFAPATFACLISVAIWYCLISFKVIYLAISIGLFAAGILLSDQLSKTMGKDPRPIVIDEYSCLLLPLFFTPLKVLPLIITFALFRVFDIVKPPPLRRLEKLQGGWGIMLDDLGAAVYTMVIIIVLQALVRF